jgi:hypothetical protein
LNFAKQNSFGRAASLTRALSHQRCDLVRIVRSRRAIRSITFAGFTRLVVPLLSLSQKKRAKARFFLHDVRRDKSRLYNKTQKKIHSSFFILHLRGEAARKSPFFFA